MITWTENMVQNEDKSFSYIKYRII